MNSLKAIMQKAVARALQLRLVRAYLLYSEHRGPALADSVTYRALFSVFAGLLLGFSLAALWLGGNPEAMQALIKALESVIPGVTDAVDLRAVEAPTGFTVVGVLSLAGLVGAALSAIGSLRIAFRTLADELYDDQNFIWVMVRNLLVAVSFGGLLALAAGTTVAASIGLETVTRWLGVAMPGTIMETLTRVLGVLVVLVINTVAVALVFKMLAGVPTPVKALWQGALLGGVGLLVLQQLSGLFVRGAASNPLLASFAALIALLIWFNLSAQVILIAASYIIVATAESHDRVRERFGAETLAQLRRRRAEDVLRAATKNLREARQAEREERQPIDSTEP